MNYIISLFKNRKVVITLIVLVLLSAVSYFGWNKIENGIYEQGYNAAVQEYQAKLNQAQKEYNTELGFKLLELRTSMQRQHEQELSRLQKEQTVDDEVRTVTEYIEREIYVKEECDTVPPNLNRMLNDSIRSINGDK